jgi:hypothetical protein
VLRGIGDGERWGTFLVISGMARPKAILFGQHFYRYYVDFVLIGVYAGDYGYMLTLVSFDVVGVDDSPTLAIAVGDEGLAGVTDLAG